MTLTSRTARTAVASLSLALVAGLTACSAGGGTSAAERDTLVIALPSEPENLNPIFADNIYSGPEKFFNGLLRYDKDLSPVPDLAARLPETSPDGKTVTVPLRGDVKFHDGRPLTAKDVVFTYESILDPKVASDLRSLLDSMREVEALDSRTVRFSLERPDPAFLDKLQIGIAPEHLLRGQDLNKAAYNRRPVGTGPYVFKEWRPGQRMVMEDNPDYFGGRAKIGRVVFTYVEDENARAAMLASGEVDLAGLVPKLAPRFRGDAEHRVLEVPSADARTVALPNDNPALKDRRVRTALSLAVDREKMVQGVLAGAGEAAYGPIMPGHWAHTAAGEVRFDPVQARRRLEGAGWRDTNRDGVLDKGGRKLGFTLMYPADDSVRRDVALATRSDLAGVGVDVKLEGLGWDAIEPRTRRDPTVFGWGTPYDPDLEAWTQFHSSFADDEDPFRNSPNMRNRRVDAAIDTARSELDRGERKQSYGELQDALADDGSWLYLMRLKHVVVLSNRIQGVDPQVAEPHAHGFSRGTSWNMDRWTLSPDA